MKRVCILRAGLLIGLLTLLPGLGELNVSNARANDSWLEELDPFFIESAVETWVRKWTPDARPNAVVEHLEPYREEGETLAYIAHLEGTGFCLCGAHNLVCPVYLYSPGSAYDPGNPGCAVILGQVADRVKYFRRALAERDPALEPHYSTLRERVLDWTDLAMGYGPRLPNRNENRIDPAKVELPLTCKWHERSPYNDDCPALSPIVYDEHVAVGNEALAMAQMMYFWQWPLIGEGTHTKFYEYGWRPIGSWSQYYEPDYPGYGIPNNWPVGFLDWDLKYCRLRYDYPNLEITGYWDHSLYTHAFLLDDSYIYQVGLNSLYLNLTFESDPYTVNPGFTSYNWDLMEDSHSDPVDPGDEAVAALCYHASNTIDIPWRVCGPTPVYGKGVHENMAEALSTYFRYDSDATEMGPANANTMIEEIQWGRIVGLHVQPGTWETF